MAYEAQKDLFPFVGSDQDTDIILFFTDNKGEPKKLNVRRSIENDELFSGNALGYSGNDLEEFITACPKAPQIPISFSWNKNLDFESNFKGIDGIQFAYQNIYVEGFVSSISTVSEVAYPPTIQGLGSDSLSSKTVESECILAIPRQPLEVREIRILFREGNSGPYRLMDTVANNVNDGNPLFLYEGGETVLGYYIFRNDSVYPIVSSDQTSKNFDNLPRKAKAQSVTGNRLMYGNYLEGFDPVKTSAQAEVIFKNVDQISAINSSSGDITSINVFSDYARDGGARGQSIGFSIDYGTEGIVPGVYTISIDVAPEKNFHIFDGTAYHPSKNVTFNGASDYDFDGLLNPVPDNDAVNLFNIKSTTTADADVESVDGTKMLYGFDPGRNGVANISWSTINVDGTLSAKIGTTAANPIVVPSALLKIDISFEVVSEVSSDSLAEWVEGIISGDVVENANISLLSHTGDDLSGFSFTEEDISSVNGVSTVLTPNLNWSSGYSFNANSSDAEKISWIPLDTEGGIADLPNFSLGVPFGFYVINKANLLVDVVPVEGPASPSKSPLFATGTNPNTATKRHYRFVPKVLTDVDVLTCIPEPVEGFGSGDTYVDGSDVKFEGPAKLPWQTVEFENDEITFLNPLGIDESQEGSYDKNYLWPGVHLARNSSGSFVSNPNFPSLGAIKKRDGETDLQFNRMLSQNKLKAPLAIGKWYVFTPEEIQNDEWRDSFKYEFSVNDFVAGAINLTYKPISTKTWLFPQSAGWQGFISGFDGRIEIFPESEDLSQPDAQFASFIDGAGGVGSRINGDGFSDVGEDEYFIPYANGDKMQYWPGSGENVGNVYTGDPKPVSNRKGTVWNSTLIGVHENFKRLHADAVNADVGAYITPDSPTDAETKEAPLNDLGSYFDVGTEGSIISSFKTNDFHDFGVVYFDSRGRSGDVNKLPSVYVPGYGPNERPDDGKGAVCIKYELSHLPPSWASSYKIVYAGASKTQRFIQYSSGGAYTEPNVIGGSNDKIYVSLNYLQRNRASYARGYGARDQDTGEQTLYRFTPGDKLRVISFFTGDETIEYVPKGYEFDVIGVEEISIEQDSPLILETEDTGNVGDTVAKYGSFVVLRNNTEASGFTAAEVSSGTDNWGDRCIFEIVSERKDRGEDIIPYYETPFGGRVILQNGELVHEYGTITMDQGDVFFRTVPVNLRPINSEGEFTDIIGGDETNETSQSRFRSYFLETDAVTDLYRSKSKSFGKVHFSIDGYRERINDTSIIFSDATNQESYNLFYTSFSPLSKNYFDLPAKYGDIDYLADSGDMLYVAQNSKIGKVSVDKSITATASGNDTLNVSNEVLNSPRFFLEDVGTDGHPESVTWEGSTMYFVDQSRGVVVSAGETGMKFLSAEGMEKFFKKSLDRFSSNSRITTGYNPFRGELVVSFFSSDISNSVDPAFSEDPYDQRTFAYDLGSGSWTSAYSFHSSEYSNVGKTFLSFKGNPFGHDRGLKNTFYGQVYPSSFTSVSVEGPNKTKTYQAISIDGTTEWNLNLKTSRENAQISRFTNYEDTFYSSIPRSENGQSKSNFKAIGQPVSVKALDEPGYWCFKFDRDISEYHITLSSRGGEVKTSEILFYNARFPSSAASPYRDVSICPTSINGSNELYVYVDGIIRDRVDFIEFVKARQIIVKSFSKLFGDPLRDKLIEVTATAFPDREKETELYSINVDYVDSKLNTSA